MPATLKSDQLMTFRQYADHPAEELKALIARRKNEVNAVLLGHYYQRIEIQEASDYVGDSLGLARTAANTEADVIVFCGVHFMAETAKILSPGKMVLMPDPDAGCPMADFATAQALRRIKALHPEMLVVTYVNSSAEVKAESDICCTSSNVVQVVESLPRNRSILFVPDRHLAAYAADRTGRPLRGSGALQSGSPPREGEILAWDGHCYVHDDLSLQQLELTRSRHPDARVVVHPEVPTELRRQADFVASTSGMVKLAEEHDELIFGTERGLVDRLRQLYPEKTLVAMSPAAICGNMKLNTLANLAWCLDHLQHEVVLEETVRSAAEGSLRRMLELAH